MQPMRVRVPVTTLWVGPDGPRGIDGPVVEDEPDVPAWLAALDAHSGDDQGGDGRLGLHGRVLTQLVAGEPVMVLDAADGSDGGPAAYQGWVQVVCPWQPSSLDPRGYPGWLRLAHLIPDDTGGHAAAPEDESWATAIGPDGRADLALAREHLGLPYLWGGLSPLGLDCSGLVHLVHRELGQVLPRDAHDQQDACRPVPVDAVVPGDLYFFARDGRSAHHVGIVSEPGRMIHATEGRTVVEERLDDRQLATLSAAGRVAGPAAGGHR